MSAPASGSHLDHEGARRLMAEAMEGRLGADDERDLALHLVGCDECKGIYEGLQQAHPALSAIELGYPSTESIDAAVHRATTVLKGDADPGPHGLSDEPPRLPDIPDANTVRIDSGGSHTDEGILIPAGPSTSTGEIPVTSPALSSPRIPPRMPNEVPEAHVRPILPDIVGGVSVSVPADDDPAPEIDEPDVTAAAGDVLPPLPVVIDVPPLPDEPPPAPAVGGPEPGPPSPDSPIGAPRSEIESLLDEDRARYEPLPIPDELDDDDRMGPGPWLVAIAVTVVLTVLAGILVTRGQQLFGGGAGDLPTASEVRSRVARAVTEMKSLKTAFDVTRIGFYRVGRDQGALRYSFGIGRFEGRIVYDRAEGYKQNLTLTVAGDELERAEIVQTADETQSLVGTGSARRLLTEENPPLGPPDGNLRPQLGFLEDSLGTAASLIASSKDLVVAEKTQMDGRELYKVRGTVAATELSRADQIEAALDANTFLPVIVKRTISKSHARVLGPASALSTSDIDRAFAQHDRVTTEQMQLAGITYDDIVLPNELVLDAPAGVAEQHRDSKFNRLTRVELVDNLDFQPLLPRTMPNGFEEDLLAVYGGAPANWGPNKSLPKPKSVFHAEYFDGKTTIVVTQRRMAERFELTGSPLARTGLPITVKQVVRDNKIFFYGTSPEVPPHAYGFLGNTFVMAVGYAPQADLIRMVASLAETPEAVPGSAEISPTSSPDESPDADSSPAATSSPASSATSTP